jgi:hypothetical protein
MCVCVCVCVWKIKILGQKNAKILSQKNIIANIIWYESIVNKLFFFIWRRILPTYFDLLRMPKKIEFFFVKYIFILNLISATYAVCFGKFWQFFDLTNFSIHVFK